MIKLVMINNDLISYDYFYIVVGQFIKISIHFMLLFILVMK